MLPQFILLAALGMPADAAEAADPKPRREPIHASTSKRSPKKPSSSSSGTKKPATSSSSSSSSSSSRTPAPRPAPAPAPKPSSSSSSAPRAPAAHPAPSSSSSGTRTAPTARPSAPSSTPGARTPAASPGAGQGARPGAGAGETRAPATTNRTTSPNATGVGRPASTRVATTGVTRPTTSPQAQRTTTALTERPGLATKETTATRTFSSDAPVRRTTTTTTTTTTTHGTSTRPGTGPGSASAPGDASRPDGRPPMRTVGSRYARPTVVRVRTVTYAHHPVPHLWGYRPYYTRWYCHPYYRYRYSTWAVVSFGFAVYPHHAWWVPPARWGWTWSAGYYAYGVWYPGYWAPIRTAPIGYVYVPGWWEGDTYVDGYYRVNARNGWEWVDGYYLDADTYIRGHWEPTGDAPAGYAWEPGFWDGKDYVDGFWRPEFRNGYTWVSSYYDEEGVYHGGYWMPLQDVPGQVWIPGWFDGNEWIEGYWVDKAAITPEAMDTWQPPEGVQDGWDEDEDPRDAPTAQLVERYREETGEAPLALPVEIGDDEGQQ